ncbi:MAG: hypothetical protein OXH82_00325 [Candidatus Dadabacteria bacterium]|nr:hypothetical protein [Candidatus Dadabacteria bacterium]MDE0662362.1 hypothetical protein [Candidatus Dadabacteria bacterium]
MERNDIPKALYEDMKKVEKIRVVVEPWVDADGKLKVRLPGTNLVVIHNPSRTASQLKDIDEGLCSRCYIFPTKGRTPNLLKKIESANERLHVTYEIDDEYKFLTIIIFPS